MRALEAAKGVEAQGEDLFIRYHFALFKALFEDNLDISDPHVLLDLAASVGADCDRLSEELKAGYRRHAVRAEHDKSVKQFRIHSVPTVVFGGRGLVVGAVPRGVYKRAIDDLLAEAKNVTPLEGE
jgi:predicted DsbA family dithiol-disulfide isomerase